MTEAEMQSCPSPYQLDKFKLIPFSEILNVETKYFCGGSINPYEWQVYSLVNMTSFLVSLDVPLLSSNYSA